MTLFSEYVQWQNYAATTLAEAENEEAKAESKLKLIEARWMASYDDPKGKVTVAKAERDTRPEVQEAHIEWLTAKAHRKMVGAIYSNCERCAQLVSRELSRRIGSGSSERRQQRWQP